MVNYGRSLITRRLKEGRFLSTGFYRDGIGASGTKKIVFVNESDADVRVPAAVVRGRFRSRVSKSFNVDLDSEGPDLDIVNKKSREPVPSSDFSVFVAGDGETGAVSNPDIQFNDKLLPAGQGTAPGAEGAEGGNILQPGDNMVVGVENLDGDGNIVSIDIDFHKIVV